MDQETRQMFERVFERFDVREKETRQMFEKIFTRFDAMDQRFDGIDQRLEVVDQRLDGLDTRIDNLTEWAVDNFVPKHEFYSFKEWVEENMLTKKEFYAHWDRLEEMYSGFKETDRNNVLIGKQLCDIDDLTADHEKRIRKLEEAK